MSTGVGDVVRVICFDRPGVVPNGTRGTVCEVFADGVMWVRWDTGDYGKLRAGFDQWQVEGSQAARFGPEALLAQRRARCR